MPTDVTVKWNLGSSGSSFSSWIISAMWRWPNGEYVRTTLARSGWCEPGLPLVAALGRTNLDLDHRLAHQTALVERPQRQIGHRRVAAHAADVLRARHLLAVQLRQTVDETFEPFGMRVRVPVPAVVVRRVAQAEVAGQIDDALGHPRELVDALPRLAVRQRQEEQVARLQHRQTELNWRLVCPRRLGWTKYANCPA